MIIIKEYISFIYWISIIYLSPRIFRNNVEYSRKFVHIMIANWWFICVAFFYTFLSSSFVPFIFLFINTYSTISKRSSLVGSLKRTNEEYSLGLIFYPLGYLVSLLLGYYFLEKPYMAGIGIMALGYGDGFAAIIGKKYNYKPFSLFGGKKTVSGSLGMFAFSFFSILFYCLVFSMKPVLLIATVTAFVSCCIEAISPYGLDNILIPLFVILSYLLIW